MSKKHIKSCLGIMVVAGLGIVARGAADVVIVDRGQARCAILVAPRVMADDRNIQPQDVTAFQAETDRRQLREAVKDLAKYIEKMSGALAPISTNAADAGNVAILIGERAQEAFGPVGFHVPGGQGYRVVAQSARIGLYGESDLGSSYAIYDILHGLGCRWYMPGDLGEVIPELRTIALAEQDRTGGPYTFYRGIWYADDNYKRRNRLGGILLSGGQLLEENITPEMCAQHPEWRAISGGKPSPQRLKWSMPGVAEALADGIIAKLDKAPGTTSVSLSPLDGGGYDDTDDKKLDAGDWDSTIGQVSLTDRQVWLCNRIVARVTKRYPDMRFSMLAYCVSTRPPVREKPHPQIVPVIAPITFARCHPMTDDRVPDNKNLRYLIKGWSKLCPEISYYYYGYLLAEPSSPNPYLTKWGIDVPIALKNNGRYWGPETAPNFETTMHALYMSIRLAWDPKQDPWAIYDEINTRFYGHAATAMAQYWKLVDKTWVDTPEYSGAGFGHMRRFPPEVLASWRAAMDSALSACRTITEYRRVKLADESLRLFELFMKLRRDLAEGHWTTLAHESWKYIGWMEAMGDEYAANYTFCKASWAWGGSGNTEYFQSFYKATYDDAARIADNKTYSLLLPKPLREFRYKDDPEGKGDSAGWAGKDFVDKDWPITDVCTQTWSSIGLHGYLGTVWYRATVNPARLPARKGPIRLWIGATDGSVKVFVNGKHIPYIDAVGKTNAVATGYCAPFSFDVTDAVVAGAINQVTIKATRTSINELGTGGLLAPVTFYMQKETPPRPE